MFKSLKSISNKLFHVLLKKKDLLTSNSVQFAGESRESDVEWIILKPCASLVNEHTVLLMAATRAASAVLRFLENFISKFLFSKIYSLL